MANLHPLPGKTRRPASDLTEAGLLQGTQVLTLDGMIPVEFLTPGDRIVTRDGGATGLLALKITDHRALNAVTIRASVLGHDRPERDVMVGADQLVLVRGWKARALYNAESALVPAARLADGDYIRHAPLPGGGRTFQLIFDAEHIIYVEGVELAMTATLSDLAV